MNHRLSIRRLPLLLAAAAALLAAPGTAPAQTAESAVPTLSAQANPAAERCFVGQVVHLDVTLSLGDAELLNWNLLDIPENGLDAYTVRGPVSVPQKYANQVGVRYEIQFRKPGEYAFEPRAVGAIQKSLARSTGFIRMVTQHPLDARAGRVVFRVEALPADDRPDDALEMVGTFTLAATLSPAECAPGDLVNLRWTLQGVGADQLTEPPPYEPGEGFRAYPPRLEAAATEAAVTQVIIPAAVGEYTLPAFSLSVFDPQTATWKRHTAGPFALRVTERAPEPDAETAVEAVVSDRLLADAQPGAAAAPDAAAVSAEDGSGLLRWWRRRTGTAFDRTLDENVPLRAAPADTAQRLFELPAAAPVQIRESAGDWRRVLCPDGRSGWVPAASIR